VIQVSTWPDTTFKKNSDTYCCGKMSPVEKRPQISIKIHSCGVVNQRILNIFCHGVTRHRDSAAGLILSTEESICKIRSIWIRLAVCMLHQPPHSINCVSARTRDTAVFHQSTCFLFVCDVDHPRTLAHMAGHMQRQQSIDCAYSSCQLTNIHVRQTTSPQ
jgi:hypothetical protein